MKINCLHCIGAQIATFLFIVFFFFCHFPSRSRASAMFRFVVNVAQDSERDREREKKKTKISYVSEWACVFEGVYVFDWLCSFDKNTIVAETSKSPTLLLVFVCLSVTSARRMSMSRVWRIDCLHFEKWQQTLFSSLYARNFCEISRDTLISSTHDLLIPLRLICSFYLHFFFLHWCLYFMYGSFSFSSLSFHVGF